MVDLTRFDKYLGRSEDFLAGVAGVILVFIVGSVCLEIVMRYFFRQPLFWVVELTEYGLLYITFLAAPWLLRHEGHVKVDVILDLFSARWRNRLGLISSTLGLGVCLVLTIFGAQTAYDHYVRKIFKITVMQFPTWIVLLCIPIGSFFLALRFARRGLGFADRLRNHPAPSPSGEKP